MKIFLNIFVVFAFTVANESLAEEKEYDCHDIAVGPEGVAWEPENQGKLVSGVVVCEKGDEKVVSLYEKGFKDGRETVTNGETKTVKIYRKGKLTETCYVPPVISEAIESQGLCINHITGERFMRRYTTKTSMEAAPGGI